LGSFSVEAEYSGGVNFGWLWRRSFVSVVL